MRNTNTGGRITYNQYKLADIMLFLVIMAVCEAINVFAIRVWFPDMLFSVSLMFTVCLIVLVRWNWIASFFPAVHGILYSALLGAGIESYAIYIIGNSCLLFSLFLFKFLPKEKLFDKWYLTLIYPAVAFVFVIFGRATVAACFGNAFLDSLGAQVRVEGLNILFAAVALLILRRFDGMLEEQKKYLLRTAREREEAGKVKEEVWQGYTELDEEELKKLHSDYSEEGDGISMYDEYPPDSR